MPLLGGQVDKVFASPRTLTVQKLGILYDAHPAFALPEWYSYGPLTITDSAGNVSSRGLRPPTTIFCSRPTATIRPS